jgi:hypothetical protein
MINLTPVYLHTRVPLYVPVHVLDMFPYMLVSILVHLDVATQVFIIMHIVYCLHTCA